MYAKDAEEFDRLRRIRNRINYYGDEVSPKEAEHLLLEIKQLLDSLQKTYEL